MTKEEAEVKFRKILLESYKKEEEAIKKAKKNGTWEGGLDGNKELFQPIKDETMRKIKELQEQIKKEEIGYG